MAGYFKALKEQFSALAAKLTGKPGTGTRRPTWETIAATINEGVRVNDAARIDHGVRTVDTPPAPAVTVSVLEVTVLADIIIDKLQGKPGGLSLIELRASLGAQANPKTAFDQAVLSLYKDGRVYLDRHDHPLRLSDAERRELVFDGTANYYVGITLREPR